MLKSKKALYVLIPLTLVIWGLISYKIYTGLKGDDITASFDDSNFLPTESLHKSIDTFVLFNNYRDPFLREIHSTQKASSINSIHNNSNSSPIRSSTINKNQISQTSNDWPSVQFSGTIKNQTSGITLILLTINNRTYTAKQGETVDGLKIVSFSSGDVTLQRGKEKRSFLK